MNGQPDQDDDDAPSPSLRELLAAVTVLLADYATVDPTSKASRAGAIADAAVVRWQHAWQVKP